MTRFRRVFRGRLYLTPVVARLRACSHRQRGLIPLIVVFVSATVLLNGCATLAPRPSPSASRISSAQPMPPAAPREFRAAWVATVANIDWPSRPGLTSDRQRSEMLAILDRAAALHLNAIILQVRPAADAIYPSRYEPWSEYLTGVQGSPPEPYYDPLKTWIREAHQRGLELHAWINPYRARHASAKSPLAANHIAKTHPAVVKAYGGQLWMDPAEPAAAAETIAVVRDLVRRYDLDGIHIDDYFYPYPVGGAEFPDDRTWQQYVDGGGRLSRADWRRENVNRLIEQLDRAIHALKPHVQFGISPFGVGRPDQRPAGIAGFSQFDDLYADVELWLERGWLDYLSPQLYWRTDQKAQSFPVLADYWARHNPAQRHIWPGLFTSAINDTPKSWSPEEILHQIDFVRAEAVATSPANNGHVHFSMIALMQNRRGIATALQTGPYAEPALVPTTPWLAAKAPRAPRLQAEWVRDHAAPAFVTISPSWFGVRPANFAVWKRFGATWRFSVQPAAVRRIDIHPDPVLGAVDAIVVSSVDRLGNESPRVLLQL